MGSTTFSGPVTSTAGFISGTDAVTSFGNGTVLLPSITFTSDPDTGFYRIGANNLGVSAAGAKVLDVSATGLGVVGTALIGNGTVSLPAVSFTADPDSGMYRIGANNVGVAVNGAKVLDVGTTGLAVTGLLSATTTLDVTGVATFANGAVGAPGVSFTSDPDTGIYRIGANNLGVAAAGAKVLDVSATGLAVTGLVSATTSVSATTTVTAGTNLVATAYIQGSVGNALTAAGSDRATSLALTKSINNVTTAAASTGVTLPAVATVGIGGSVIIFNAGANAIQVYGDGSDTIDGVAGATGVPLTNAKRAVFIAVAAATWISAQLGVVSA